MFHNSSTIHRLTGNTAFHSGENRLVYRTENPEDAESVKRANPLAVRAFIAALFIGGLAHNVFTRGCGETKPEPEPKPVVEKKPSADMCLPAILPLEEYVKYTEGGLAENPIEVQQAWIKEVKPIIAPLEPPKEEDIVDIDKAFPLFKEKGKEAVLALGKKWVRFPKMCNTPLSFKNAIPMMERYQKDNVDLANEVFVNTGLIGKDRLPAYLPKHFWEKLQEAAKEKGIPKEKILVSTGVRNHVQQAVMFVRTVYSACDNKYPSEAPPECIKFVENHLAGKPGKLGRTHFPSADVNNWEAFKQPLIDRGFAVGCNGFDGINDPLHTTWGAYQKDATLKCKGFQTYKKYKNWAKNKVKSIWRKHHKKKHK